MTALYFPKTASIIPVTDNKVIEAVFRTPKLLLKLGTTG